MSPTDTAAIAQAVRRTVADIHPDPELHGKLYDLVVEAAERQVLESVLRYHRGNQSQSARHLGINRNTLRKLIRRHQIIF